MEVFLRFYFKLVLNDPKIFLCHLLAKNYCFAHSFLNFTPELLVSDVLFLEVLVISCIISKKNVTFVMRSLLK